MLPAAHSAWSLTPLLDGITIASSQELKRSQYRPTDVKIKNKVRNIKVHGFKTYVSLEKKTNCFHMRLPLVITNKIKTNKQTQRHGS